ncbi:MAG: hypothetical protein JOZ54_23365 [Acidobacteria bacterium]|nr:hypothetical protein [Acidobacteriota bacterium]
MRQRGIFFLYIATVLIGVTSATGFILQGGFGGGHGDWDLVIWLSSLPWILIAWPKVVPMSDAVRMTLLPFILNMLTITVLRAILKKRSRSSAATSD